MHNYNNYPKVIFPEGFDERSEFELPLRGYLSHSFVELQDGRRYAVYFVDPVRLRQDLEEYVKQDEPCFAEPGLIVLPEVTVNSIYHAVSYLYEQGYFSQLKSLD